MSDLGQVVRTLPRIKKHLLNPDNMRWVHITPAHRLVHEMFSSIRTGYLFEIHFQFNRIHIQIKMCVGYRCAVNTTPQKMSDAAAQLESFMEEVAENRKQRKPVKRNITEVRYQPINHIDQIKILINFL